MPHFKDYFSEEYFVELMKSHAEDTITFYSAVDKFLKDNNLLKPFRNSETHHTNFKYYYNKYLTSQSTSSDFKENIFDNIFSNYITYETVLFNKDNKELTSQEIEDRYNSFTQKITEGNFKPFELPKLFDFDSGINFSLTFREWEPVLLTYTHGKTIYEKGSFAIAPEMPIAKVVDRQIEFKTGNLIIADWFKIEKFTEIVDKDTNFQINSAKGRMDQSEYYLNRFNFIHTSAYESSDVLQKGDTIILNRYDEHYTEPAQFQNKGSVDQVLRALSIIEKEHLIALVGSESLVDSYLKEYENCIVELKVKPGTYAFTISSSPDLINSQFENLNLFKNIEAQNDLLEITKDKYFKPTLILQGLELKPTRKNKPR